MQVKTDQNGRMDARDLKKVIIKAKDEGRLPFFVNATAGTTVLGAIDPLKEIAKVCRSMSVWFHVDVRINSMRAISSRNNVIWIRDLLQACLGGSLLLSESYKFRLHGIELFVTVFLPALSRKESDECSKLT